MRANDDAAGSLRILFCREKLAPTLRKDWPLHDLALLGRDELQANLAALRALWKPLVVGIRLLDLVRFFDFLIGYCPRGGAARDQNTDRQTSALDQGTA
ncbi:MAG: hypothetical protein JO282_05860 [Alphaproteobacteria bacterium]|nr:hypothetical protein [Alphaproteobacteria bacterium]